MRAGRPIFCRSRPIIFSFSVLIVVQDLANPAVSYIQSVNRIVVTPDSVAGIRFAIRIVPAQRDPAPPRRAR